MSASASRSRIIQVCAHPSCGYELDCGAECHEHPDADIVDVEIFLADLPGRDRAAEMVTFAAREVLTVSDAPADDRAACRMVLDSDAHPQLGEQVIRAYQQLRRDGRL